MSQENTIKNPEKNIWPNKSSILILPLNPDERIELGKQIAEFEKIIISSWIENSEMQKFYEKYNIQPDEIHEYIEYFWSKKILHCIINELREDVGIYKKDKYISTKFLSFIKKKNLWVEDLLKIIILLKNSTISFFLNRDFKIIYDIIERFDVISTDISKNYNDIIIKLLDEYIKAIDSSSIISKTDIHGRIIAVNEEFCKLSWFSDKELIWSAHNIVRHPDMSKEVFKDLWDTIRNKKIWKWTIKNKAKDGSSYWVQSTIVPILDENDQIMEYISIRTDITDLEIAQQELERSLDKQKELDVKKDEFLNIASHELRTPMTSIKWYISMILDGDAGTINEEVRSYLVQVYKGSQRLLDLINDMLDISKIESWKQELMMGVVDIASLIQEMVTEMNGLFLKKQQNFIVSVDFKDFKYTTDENKLKQVLFNLLWNANKFTPEWWTVRLDCKKMNHQIVISIEDSGIGIEKGYFDKIFEKFWQVKNSLTRDINGTWLGLPIVKAIIEQMNGKITMESEFWRGSKFSIYLPIP